MSDSIPDPSPKVFTQEDVNRIVKERMARLKRQPSDPDETKTLREQNEQLLQQNEQLSKALSQAHESHQEAVHLRKVQSKDANLRESLQKLKCTDIKAAERYLNSDISQNPDRDWIIRTPDNRILPLSVSSIEHCLPDVFKPPRLRGGSGAPLYKPDGRQNELKEAISQMGRAYKMAIARLQDTHLMVEYKVMFSTV